MIKVYPLLCASTINQSILPGMCKVLERYIIIYMIDTDLMKKLKSGSIKKEDYDYIIKNDKFVLSEKGSFPPPEDEEKQNIEKERAEREKGKELRDIERAEREKRKELRDIEKHKKDMVPAPEKHVDTKLNFPNFESLSVEPTWITIQDKDGLRPFGVKVVPIIVKSDEQFHNLLLRDKSLGFFNYVLERIYRSVIRKFWAIHRKIPFTRQSISGDAFRDIIWQRSLHEKGTIFCAFDGQELNEGFFSSTSSIIKLNKLGWYNFIVDDTINKKVYFCMRTFHGLCSVLNYAFMYSTLKQDKAFSSVDDARRNSSPFMKLSTKINKIL